MRKNFKASAKKAPKNAGKELAHPGLYVEGDAVCNSCRARKRECFCLVQLRYEYFHGLF